MLLNNTKQHHVDIHTHLFFINHSSSLFNCQSCLTKGVWQLVEICHHRHKLLQYRDHSSLLSYIAFHASLAVYPALYLFLLNIFWYLSSNWLHIQHLYLQLHHKGLEFCFSLSCCLIWIHLSFCRYCQLLFLAEFYKQIIVTYASNTQRYWNVHEDS